uniref:G-protein coupled receptors family 1 profile domain-containing protein n=1 Tax=Ciona savignyi TaxID=51511 RepID=H2ZK74_CIOSA
MCSIFSVWNVVANAIVLVVFFMQKRYTGSAGIYKISIALADIMVGLFIFPTFASSLSKITMTQEKMGPSSNTSITPGPGDRYDIVPHMPGGDVWTNFDQPYLNFVGFFTSMYLTLTIYTLMVACIDRLVYVRNSRTYSNQKSTFVARITIGVSWLVSIIVAIVPFFVDRYNLIASVMVLSSGATSLYLYIIAYVIPLLVLWVGGIVLLVFTIMRSRKRRT